MGRGGVGGGVVTPWVLASADALPRGGDEIVSADERNRRVGDRNLWGVCGWGSWVWGHGVGYVGGVMGLGMWVGSWVWGTWVGYVGVGYVGGVRGWGTVLGSWRGVTVHVGSLSHLSSLERDNHFLTEFLQ